MRPSALCLLDFFFFYFMNGLMIDYTALTQPLITAVLSWMSQSVLPNRLVISDLTECEKLKLGHTWRTRRTKKCESYHVF